METSTLNRILNYNKLVQEQEAMQARVDKAKDEVLNIITTVIIQAKLTRTDLVRAADLSNI